MRDRLAVKSSHGILLLTDPRESAAMPLVFRSMLADGSGSMPRIGHDAESLGVRVSEETGGTQDITVVGGKVQLGREGMSVSPSILLLPSHRLPKKFKGLIPELVGRRVPSGKNDLICWQMGEGAFEDSRFAPGLLFLTQPMGSPKHGVISPEAEVPLEAYRIALANTRPDWTAVPWPWEGDRT